MHPFFTLRNQLPELALDPAVDSASHLMNCQALKAYQARYQQGLASLSSFHAIGKITVEAHELMLQYWLPLTAAETTPRGSVLVLHGYFDHSGLYSHLIQALLAGGFAVLAYDQPGHGLSGGESAAINDFAAYSEVLGAVLARCHQLPQPLHFIGQSTGGATYLQRFLLEQHPDPFAKAVLLAPLLRPCHWPTLQWVFYLLSPFIKQLPRRISINSNDPAFVHFVHHEDPLQSMVYKISWIAAMHAYYQKILQQAPDTRLQPLIIQGQSDTTVDWHFNCAVLPQKMPACQLTLIPEARHHLANESKDLRDEVFSQVMGFLLASMTNNN